MDLYTKKAFYEGTNTFLGKFNWTVLQGGTNGQIMLKVGSFINRFLSNLNIVNLKIFTLKSSCDHCKEL